MHNKTFTGEKKNGTTSLKKFLLTKISFCFKYYNSVSDFILKRNLLFKKFGKPEPCTAPNSDHTDHTPSAEPPIRSEVGG